jgi:hypothetical protein
MINKPIITKEMQQFLIEIADEHFRLTKDVDSNISYLWYLYSAGTKKGDYKPFIFFAEINLNFCMGLLNEDEKKNIMTMIESPDEDNLYLAYLAVMNTRKERHKKFGSMIEFPAYTQVKSDYLYKVLSHDLFMQTMKK